MAQSGAPVINFTFGDSAVNPGPALPAHYTAFRYSADSCPPPGYYTITNSLYRCVATRMGRSIDNTPGSKNGYMMVVNDTVSQAPKLLFVDTIKESLCAGTHYTFSAYFLNVEIPGYCNSPNIHFPSFTFTVETSTGQVLASGNTGAMSYDYVPPPAPPATPVTPRFHPFALGFQMPAGINELVVKIKDDPYLYPDCGYAFALDDIQFAAAGPKASIAFDDAAGNIVVKSVCFQNNQTIAMSGTVPPGNAVQWQQSTDSGRTWLDIAGATDLHFSKTFSVADTFLLRMRAGEPDKIGNPNCSVVSNVLTVNVEGLPRNYKITTNSPVCAGSVLHFKGEGDVRFTWSGPNGFYDDVGYTSIYNITLADSGTYFANIISYGGCVTKDSLHVQVLGSEDVTVSKPEYLCKGKSVRLSATGGTHYLWTPAKGLSNPQIANPVAAPEITTTYQVKVSNDFGCVDSANVKVTIVNSIPVKAIIAGPDYLCRPVDSALFKDISTGAVNSWTWELGNGMKSTARDPGIATYFISANVTAFTVRLAVSDSLGCADTTSKNIAVESNCYIAVPGAFTPNGDGLNDYLYPLNAYKATGLLFVVYNRYGRLVFETQDWTKKWDGTTNGEQMPGDVYVWQLNYTDQFGKRISLKGSTLLIR